MIRLTWNEIRNRAQKFSHAWAGVESERAEAQTFWNEFFNIFGIERRTVASFEDPVRNLKGKYSFIDLFWRGVLLVEHKSLGSDLSKAKSQAFTYIQDLAREGKDKEIPRYVVISDFSFFVIFDLERPGKKRSGDFCLETIIPLADLPIQVKAFAFLRNEDSVRREPEDPANIEAAEIMGKLHLALDQGGFKGHELERFLVRVLFCLFAEDSGIFGINGFSSFLKNYTRDDGSDLGAQLNQLFSVLNTPEENRQSNLNEDLKSFPYVNGALFAERLGFVDFNKKTRDALINCTEFNWSQISPAVFGSMFQSIMGADERRGSGAHYTSEKDILKLIHPLFLDELINEFEKIKLDRSTQRKTRLKDFVAKLNNLTLLDPACGCGNFLVISYRELRLLELEALKLIYGTQTEFSLDEVNNLSKVSVEQMFGIEVAEWPARIAEVALWLMDHQMNQEVSRAFGQSYLRIPLKQSPHIVFQNALTFDWEELLPKAKCNYVLGNPPFIGKKIRTDEQQKDMEMVFGANSKTGVLDYVCCWYRKASEYIQGTKIGVGFVSTNSITQGEQPGILWPILFGKFGLKIWFGYRTFPWESEAKGKAHVHVVIIGFGAFDKSQKIIFEVAEDKTNISKTIVSNISPYLTEGPDVVVEDNGEPLSPNVPEMNFGNMPNDDGNFLLTDSDKQNLIKEEPKIKKYIHRFLSNKETLWGIPRWCIWLKDVEPKEINEIKEIKKRVEAVKAYRLDSDREATRKLAAYPALFGEIRQPNTSFVLVPRHSSENRKYIPMCYFTPDNIVADSCLFLPNASLYHFGVLNSTMHMAWVKQVCGRIKSDYRYSVNLVYNNFPWPEPPNTKQVKDIEECVERILKLRDSFPKSSLADLYDPLSMPPDLTKAHSTLDREIEKCYRKEPFQSDRERFEFLFEIYLKLKSPLVHEPIGGKKKRRVKK